MKPFAAFIKMQLNINYSISALKFRFTREKKKLWEPVLIGVAILLSLLPLLALYTGLMLSVFAAGSIIGQPEMVLAVSFMFSQAVILLFGIIYIMGTFYFSRDIETFVPLPLKPYEVIGGKFIVIMVNEYLTSVPLLLPPVIIFGIGTGQGLLYWVKGLLLMLSVPVIPLAAASLVIILLMRIVNLRRYKDLLAIVGGLSAMFMGIGFSMLMQRVPENPQDIRNFFSGQTGMVEMIGRRFPPALWATKGLAEGGFTGIGYTLLFICVCVLLFVLMLWISNLVFYKALLAGQEVSRKRKALTDDQLRKRYAKADSPVIALIKREWRLLVRTPLYVINGLAGSVVGPFIIILMLVIQGSEPELQGLFNELIRPELAQYVLLGGLGVMLFTAGMNLVASTALSREGQTIWIAKMIPATARQQVSAKLFVSLIVSAIGVLVTGALMCVFLKMNVLWVLGVTLLGILGSLPMAALNLLIDVFHPKLVWNSEQEAMKQNMNGGIGMLISLLVLSLLGAAAGAVLLLRLPMILAFAAVGIASIILGALSLLALFGVAERKYREIEA